MDWPTGTSVENEETRDQPTDHNDVPRGETQVPKQVCRLPQDRLRDSRVVLADVLWVTNQ
jgi:hypothetical protein